MSRPGQSGGSIDVRRIAESVRDRRSRRQAAAACRISDRATDPALGGTGGDSRTALPNTVPATASDTPNGTYRVPVRAIGRVVAGNSDITVRWTGPPGEERRGKCSMAIVAAGMSGHAQALGGRRRSSPACTATIAIAHTVGGSAQVKTAENVTGAGWGSDLLAALNDRDNAWSGPLVVVVPDDATLYAVQRLCFAREQGWNRCLTARYRIDSPDSVGTMLSALASDVRAIADGVSTHAGDVLDSAEGRHWASYAQGVVERAAGTEEGSDLLGSLIAEPVLTPDMVVAFVVALTGEEARSSTVAEPPRVDHLETKQGLTSGNRLVLLIDGGHAPADLEEYGALALRLTRRMALVIVHPGGFESANILRHRAPSATVLLIDTARDQVPYASRLTYLDRPLAADRPAEHDELGVVELARTTAALLLEWNTGPICIGIEGPWGKGKSTFLRLVETELSRIAELSSPLGPAVRPAPTIVRFNAWTYESAQEAWAGLAITVLEAIESAQDRTARLRLRLDYANRFRRGPLIAWAVAGVAAALIAVVLLVVGGRAAVDRGSEPGGVVLAVLATVVSPAIIAAVVLVAGLYRLARPVSERVTEYLSRPDHASRLGYQHRVIADLAFTLDWYRDREHRARVVVMVDDLDRCSEDKVVEIIQAINVVLAECKVYTLLAVDGAMVRRAIYRHYRDPGEDQLPVQHQLPADFSSEYLEKIVQFFVRLPQTSVQNRQAYVARMFDTPVETWEPKPGRSRSVHGDFRQPVAPHDLVFYVDRTALAMPELIAYTPVWDTLEEQEAMARYQALLDDNPRELKRAVNLHRFVKLALFRSESPPDADTQRLLVPWVVLCIACPAVVQDMLARGRIHAALPEFDLLGDLDDRTMSWLTERTGGIDVALRVSDLPLLVRAADIIRMTTDRPQD